MRSFVVVEHRSLNEVVYDAIKEKILSSEFPSGFRLNEEPLVKMLGTSKTPIKIALAKLEQEGLVQTVPRRGTYVIQLTNEMMIEIYSLREVLEGLAARVAAQNITDDVLKKIRDNLSKFNPERNNITLNRYLKLDEWFHQTIIQEAKHHYLEEALRRLFDIINMFKLRAASVRQNSGEPYQEHLRIFKALEAKDQGVAEESMRIHIKRVMQVLLDNLECSSNKGAS
jgi:DNA-binding GntR family transcriptional regulator